MEPKYTEKQKMIKEQFYADRGKWKWNDTWETILNLNADILSAYSRLSSVPNRKSHLDEKTRQLLYIAIDNVITHYYTPGFMSHLRHGMVDLGVTKEEAMEVFAISSTIGTPTYTECVPILVEQLKNHGVDIAAEDLTEEQKKLKKKFIDMNGHWSYNMESILKLDTEMFEYYMDYVDASIIKGVLDPKAKELVYIAVNASPTALNLSATELHIKKALELGVTKEQIMEVFEVIACLGVHSVTVGIPALNDLMKEEEAKNI